MFVNFEHTSHLVFVFLLLTLNMQLPNEAIFFQIVKFLANKSNISNHLSKICIPFLSSVFIQKIIGIFLHLELTSQESDWLVAKARLSETSNLARNFSQ